MIVSKDRKLHFKKILRSTAAAMWIEKLQVSRDSGTEEENQKDINKLYSEFGVISFNVHLVWY